MSQFDRRGEVIEITITEGDAGLFYATSNDLPGLLVAAEDVPSVIREVPGVIKMLFAAKEQAVEVFPVKRDQKSRAWPWVAIPAHVAAEALCG